MKRVIIVQHNGGRLANQLWNFISIYAYAKERGYECVNYSFFEYQRFFSIPIGNPFINVFFFWPYEFALRFVKEKNLLPWWRKYYKFFVLLIERLYGKQVLYSHNSVDIAGVFYLPPTQDRYEVRMLEQNSHISKMYLDGWLFRNPAGIKKYREEIKKYFAPQPSIQKSVDDFMQPLRAKYSKVFGVHIRQGDYRTFKGGSLYQSPEEIRKNLDQYLEIFHLNKETACFIICSNEKIDPQVFSGLNVIMSSLDVVGDLFLLSSCDAIIGSDSSFGSLASYFGDIPHYITNRNQTDWQYYKDKTTFFENNYSTMTHY